MNDLTQPIAGAAIHSDKEPDYIDIDRSITELGSLECILDDMIVQAGLEPYAPDAKSNGLESVPSLMQVLKGSSARIRDQRGRIEERIHYLRDSLLR